MTGSSLCFFDQETAVIRHNTHNGASLQGLQFYFHIHASGEIELHQRVHRLIGGIHDVHQPQMGPNLELIS